MNWRKWTLAATTIALFVLFVSHPELRLLIPLIDMVGIDLFAVLIGVQAWACLKSWWSKLQRAVLVPSARRLFSCVIFLSGVYGPCVEAYVHTRFSNYRCPSR